MLRIFFIIFIALIAQLQIIPLFNLPVDFLLIITLYYGFLYGWNIGAGVGLLSGILQDIFSGSVLGLSSVGLFICGLLAGYSRQILLLRYWTVRVALVFLFTITNMLIYVIIAQIFMQIDFFYVFSKKWFIMSFWNVLFSGFIFWTIDRYE